MRDVAAFGVEIECDETESLSHVEVCLPMESSNAGVGNDGPPQAESLAGCGHSMLRPYVERVSGGPRETVA